MADSPLLRHYYHLGITPRFPIVSYFKTFRHFLRCPCCQGDARVLEQYLVCGYCHRGWVLQDLLYPIADNAVPATSSGTMPASGDSATREIPASDAARTAHPHANMGGVNFFAGRMI